MKKMVRSETGFLRGLALILLLQTMMASSLFAAEKQTASEIPQEWKPTTLSEKTQAKINQAVAAYHQCLNEETSKHIKDSEDSRKLTDLILTACDPKLDPIKPAFQAEKVPDTISDHYLKRKRSQAAQEVVRVTMGAHALRYRESHPQ